MPTESSRDVLTADSYRQILEAAPDAMVVVDAAGAILFANLQTEKMFGYLLKDLLGQRLEMLVPERFRGGHQGHVARYFARSFARPMGSGLELFGRRADGTELAIEVSLSPVGSPDEPMVSAAIRDITDRRRVEAAAKLAADRLASAVESIEDAFALFDAADCLVLCNSAYRVVVGESIRGALVGVSYEAILDTWSRTLAFATDEERARFCADRMAEHREPKGATDARTRDDRHLRITSRRTMEAGTVETIWDLTDDARRQEELLEARKAAEAGSEAKSEFLASMSHELRTPLNAILGFAQLLQRDKKEPLSARHALRAGHILKSGEHLLHLIDDILDLSRIEAGGVSISTEPVSPIEVLEEVKRILETMAAKADVTVELEPLPAGLPMVSVDRTRFIQILMNFGSNAVKYNRPSGRVTFAVSRPTSDLVRIAVTDTGIGIPEDQQAKLFQPFQRAGQETGSIEGTGIGLVIARRLARLMHGDVGFSSASGEGSIFWVDVPVHASSAAPSRAPAMRHEAIGGGGDHRLVLYVEDNPANVTFMMDLLSAFEGIELLVAPTAEVGIELARARRPAVILMDINLPGMSGIDALRVLRGAEETDETRKIPVIALTAAASERDKQRGAHAGFFKYLTKPVKVDELVAALEAVLAASA